MKFSEAVKVVYPYDRKEKKSSRFYRNATPEGTLPSNKRYGTTGPENRGPILPKLAEAKFSRSF
jgi:hypothetical protein